MAAKGDKSRSRSPTIEDVVEALRVKNSNLTQAVAKLQRNNADLLKQVQSLQGEIFEITSKYNNLKNVISAIESTTETCHPKLNEVVEAFAAIIQRCKDTRTEGVKPQILHNPTITLSRLSNDNPSNTSPRPSRSLSDYDKPGTSRDCSESNERTSRDFSVCKTTRLSRREQSDVDMSSHQEESDDSDVEDDGEEESDSDQSHHRLTTIREMEEEAEAMLDSVSPRSRQRSFLQDRHQELPNTYIEQFPGSGNISISVSPPERRSSFQHRFSYLVDEDDSDLDDDMNCARILEGEASFNDDTMQNQSKPNEVVESRPSRDCSESNEVRNRYSQHDSDSSDKDDQHDEDSVTANSPRTYDSPNRSKSGSMVFKSNITKRKVASQEDQVLLNRLSMEKRLPRSPIKAIEAIVDLPLIRNSPELTKSFNNDTKAESSNTKIVNGANSDEENVEKQLKGNWKSKRKKNTPVKKAGDNVAKPEEVSPPKTITGRPERAARPKTLKEPNLTKKMRRSK